MKDIKEIRSEFDRIGVMLQDGADNGGLCALDRDYILAKLRTVYDSVLQISVAAAAEPTCCVAAVEENVEPTPCAESVCEQTIEPQAEPEPEYEAVFSEPEPQPEPEPEPEQTTATVEDEPEIYEDEQIIEQVQEPQAEEPVQAQEGDIPFAFTPPVSRNIIDSLYGSESHAHTQTRQPAPQQQEKPHQEPQHPTQMESLFDLPPVASHTDNHSTKVFGETIGTDKVVLNETLSQGKRPDVASRLSAQAVTDLRRSIGINDKFLLMRDLFGGDAALYDKTLNDLNNFTDIDDAFIYLQENFVLNPDSDAVKLLVDLVNRKFS